MASKIASALRLPLEPVALIWTNDKPQDAMEFTPGRWGCVMTLLAAAAKGKTAVVSRETFGCVGAGVGLGFDNQYGSFPGGEEGFCRFLSSGNAGSPTGEAIGQQIAATGAAAMAENFLRGEGLFKNPQIAARALAGTPIIELPSPYVVLKPLGDVDFQQDDVRSITFLVNPDQLTALLLLTNRDLGDNEHVCVPFSSGCQVIGLYSYRENGRENPRPVVGLTDLSARKTFRTLLGEGLMSLAVTTPLYHRMEAAVDGSFLERPVWKDLVA